MWFKLMHPNAQNFDGVGIHPNNFFEASLEYKMTKAAKDKDIPSSEAKERNKIEVEPPLSESKTSQTPSKSSQTKMEITEQ